MLLTLGAPFGFGLFNIFPDHQPALFGPVFFVLASGRVGSGRVGSGRDSGIVAIGPIDINGLEVITRARIYHELKKKRPEGRLSVYLLLLAQSMRRRQLVPNPGLVNQGPYRPIFASHQRYQDRRYFPPL